MRRDSYSDDSVPDVWKYIPGFDGDISVMLRPKHLIEKQLFLRNPTYGRDRSMSSILWPCSRGKSSFRTPRLSSGCVLAIGRAFGVAWVTLFEG